MPRKVEARWNTEAMIESKGRPFTDEEAAPLLAALRIAGDGAEATAIRAELEYAAELYLRDRGQKENVPSRAQRNHALRKIDDLLDQLFGHLSTLDHTTEFEIVERLRPSDGNRYPTYLNHVKAIRELQSAVGSALRLGERTRGPERATELARAVHWLTGLFERCTGTRFTHNPNERLVYSGRPNSPCDHFVVEFFKIVDSEVLESRLISELAALVKARNQRRREKPA